MAALGSRLASWAGYNVASYSNLWDPFKIFNTETIHLPRTGGREEHYHSTLTAIRVFVEATSSTDLRHTRDVLANSLVAALRAG